MNNPQQNQTTGQTNQEAVEEVLTEREVNAQLEQHKCSACGANMAFAIETGGLKCRHCNSQREFNDTEKVQRRQICNEILGKQGKWNEAKVFQCSNCGAREALTERKLATKCAFCGSSKVLEINELPGIKPDSVIPFRITEQTARENFTKWQRKQWFTPGEFKRADLRKQLTKLYTPCWSFSAHTENIYTGTLGRTIQVQKTRMVDGKMQSYSQSQVHWFRVNGQLNQTYQDHFIQSGGRITAGNFNALKPFDLQQVRVYRQEYLSGIIAEHYTKDLEVCFNEFSLFIKRDMRTRIMSKHNATQVCNLDIRTRFLERKFNYILLPLYIANYNFKGRTFNFYVNGASGKVVGRYPKSKLKIALFVLGIGAVVAAAVWGLLASGIFGGGGGLL